MSNMMLIVNIDEKGWNQILFYEDVDDQKVYEIVDFWEQDDSINQLGQDIVEFFQILSLL